MIESVAGSRPSQFSESDRAISILPSYIRNQDFKIIRLLRDYYDYINSEGNPSYEINSITDNHDIDSVSEKYITEIANTFARNVPQAKLIDKNRFYKLAISYYKERGSENSVYSFFRIFFDEFISIAYPKEKIFVSSGINSETSSTFYVQDGEFYQDFSYVLSSENPSSEWRESYARFVHPAGLKFFVAFVIVMTNMNCWNGPPEEYLRNFDFDNPIPVDEWWDNIDWTRLKSYNNPKFQAPTFPDISHILVWRHPGDRYRNLGYFYNGVDSKELFPGFLNILISVIHRAVNHHMRNFRAEYQRWLKFSDTSSIDAWGKYTIEQGLEDWKDLNECRFEAFSQMSDDWIIGEVPTPSPGYVFLYDHLDRLVHDHNGKVVEVKIQDGNILVYIYDDQNNLIAIHSNDPYSLVYTFNLRLIASSSGKFLVIKHK